MGSLSGLWTCWLRGRSVHRRSLGRESVRDDDWRWAMNSIVRRRLASMELMKPMIPAALVPAANPLHQTAREVKRWKPSKMNNNQWDFRKTSRNRGSGVPPIKTRPQKLSHRRLQKSSTLSDLWLRHWRRSHKSSNSKGRYSKNED